MKLISDAYLYQHLENYNKTILKYLLSAQRVDKSPDKFSDIIYAIKKQANSVLLKVLLSDKVVLMMDANGGMSRAFKVMYAKDASDPNKPKKVFIDCTDLIIEENGVYVCKKIGYLISYLISAMAYIIYYNNPKAIVANNTMSLVGSDIFVNLMLYVFGYLKVPITYADNKERMSFVLAEYYMYCVLGNDSESIVYNTAKKISKIQDKNTCDYLHTLFSFTFKEGEANIYTFLNKFSEVFLDQKDKLDTKTKSLLTVEALAHRWMYAYGAGTFLGLECFVPFSAIISDCYTGAFINQQNTIEKVGGSKSITKFTNELLQIGGENA